ncbi:hypothetical protein EYF80_009960 [Liparis tanakae]|uniref:Uncharacterized protein n=1 Tax=Liparis tanakae TaxID=230148 RepID=A0A4Z2IRV4_9TELE|nr:hypothetical protein EYF80_009960 [Liparis tanakae]
MAAFQNNMRSSARTGYTFSAVTLSSGTKCPCLSELHAKDAGKKSCTARHVLSSATYRQKGPGSYYITGCPSLASERSPLSAFSVCLRGEFYGCSAVSRSLGPGLRPSSSGSIVLKVNRGYFLHLIGRAHLPIVLHGSVHHQKGPMAERNPNLLHIGEVAILFLRATKKENTY